MSKTAEEKIAALEQGVVMKANNGFPAALVTIRWDDEGQLAFLSVRQYQGDRTMTLSFDHEPKEPVIVLS